VVAAPAFQQKAQEQGATADYLDPRQMDARVKQETATWQAVVKASRIEAD